MSKEIQPITTSTSEGEIVLYQPDDTITLEVQLHDESVWLSQQQMAQLFNVKVPAVSKHIRNIYEEGELQRNPTISILETVRMEGKRKVTRNVEYYNLDVIISVGYRIKSQVGTRFRQWANSVLKQYLLRGYAMHQQMLQMEERISNRLDRQLQANEQRFLSLEERQDQQQQQLDFFIRTSTPPAEMVFYEGDFYTARAALENLVKTATTRAIIIDAYVSALTLDILDARACGVEAVIYTTGVGSGMTRLMQEHDRLFPDNHIDIRKWRNESHDRWLIIDDVLYHCGHSLNANGGHRISAITRMGTSPDTILSQM
ncbi:MAG: virulence RhuM family protein [Prevotella sp.]|nr:virulence RhuM family protein [Candidatus Prevotella equi]